MFRFAFIYCQHVAFAVQTIDIKCIDEDRKPISTEEPTHAYFGAQKQWYII